MKITHISVAMCLCLSAASFSANGAGGLVGSILKEHGYGDTTKSATTPDQILQSQTLTEPQAVAASIQLSDIIGIYELVSCDVRYTNGSTFRCSDYTFSGDAAITPHNTAWLRASISGVGLAVGSGVFTLSNNTMTVLDDIDHETDVGSLAWDGQRLTITYVEPDNTEIDVWRRIVAPSTPCPTISDSDGDGVIDQWDKCAGTTAGSCVDNSGCPVDIPRCINLAPTYNLLLDDEK